VRILLLYLLNNGALATVSDVDVPSFDELGERFVIFVSFQEQLLEHRQELVYSQGQVQRHPFDDAERDDDRWPLSQRLLGLRQRGLELSQPRYTRWIDRAVS